MNKDEIMQALKLTAMGRWGHPLQEQLADKLEALFAEPQAAAELDESVVAAMCEQKVAAVVKRGPGRPPKAKAD